MTEALAATSSQDEIFEIIHNTALRTIDAVASTEMLIDDLGRLNVVALQGYPEGKASIWHHASSGPVVPLGEAMTQRQPLYFELQDDLISAYPEMEDWKGTAFPWASAVLPMFLDSRPLGALIVDFQEPHEFTRVERRFLPILAAQCALAVGRARVISSAQKHLDQLTRDYDTERRQAVLLASLGDALQSATSPEETAAFTLSRMGPALQALSMLVVRLDGQQIRLPTLWGDVPQVIFDYMTRPGLTLQETPLLLRAVRDGRGFYLEDYRLEQGMLSSFPALAVGVEPIRLPDGALEGFLVVWRPPSLGSWLLSEQNLTRRAANTLGLALERSQQAQALREKNAELEARTQALEGFALLSRDFSLEHDPVRLVGRAQDLILSLLPEGMSTYYEFDEEAWNLLSYRGIFRDLTFLKKLQGGLPKGSIQNIERPYETQLPYYQDFFDANTTNVAREEFTAVRTTAALPVFVGDDVYGVLVVGLYEVRAWSAPERAVLETVTRSLGLALERSAASAQLFEQRDALAQSNQDLQQANEELEAFTYSASHDLRTPVRHVMGFAELAQKALATTPNEKAQQHLEVVKQAALRMTALIDGMLVLSRSGRQELNLEAVDLNDLVIQARRDVGAEFVGRPVRWHIGELPRVRGDRGMLQQVLTNLLSNAVKYSSKREISEVKIWCEEHPAGWRVFVQDNGAGFAQDYAEKLFGIFQRLHTEKEFQGTGVGLATVRRIILKHGGQVFAESPDDSGATFSFMLLRGNLFQL